MSGVDTGLLIKRLQTLDLALNGYILNDNLVVVFYVLRVGMICA
jgi:hypothetical protein